MHDSTHHLPNTLYQIAFSPSGELMAMLSAHYRNDVVSLWDATTGVLLASSAIGGSYTGSQYLAFSADEKLLVVGDAKVYI